MSFFLLYSFPQVVTCFFGWLFSFPFPILYFCKLFDSSSLIPFFRRVFPSFYSIVSLLFISSEIIRTLFLYSLLSFLLQIFFRSFIHYFLSVKAYFFSVKAYFFRSKLIFFQSKLIFFCF